MRFRSPLPTIAATLLLLGSGAPLLAQNAATLFQIRQVQGTVTVHTSSGVTGNVINGAQPGTGDRLATAADSSFVLDLDDSVSLWIGPESSVTVFGSVATDLRVMLQHGSCVVDKRHRPPEKNLKLFTPLGAIHTAGGTAMVRLPADPPGRLLGLVACTLAGEVRLDLGGHPHEQPAIPAGKIYDSRQQPAGQHPARATLHDIPVKVAREVTDAARLIARRKE